MIKLEAAGNHLKVKETERITSGSVGVNEVQFTFDDSWVGLSRTAVFSGGGGNVPVLLDHTNMCFIPPEAIQRPWKRLKIGVYGTDGTDVVIPTIWAEAGIIVEGTYTGVDTDDVTPDLLGQVLNAANVASETAYELQRAAENGEFNGEPGPAGAQGPKGDKGDTGATGPQGPQGEAFTYEDFTPEQLEALRGPKGDKGDTGATGPAGAQGEAFTYEDFTPEQLEALRGPKGDKGDTGATGPAGAQGPKGDTGATGEQGPKGDKGDTGATGPAGAQGEAFTYEDFTPEQLEALRGPKGDKGDTGATGPQGPQGTTGATGAAGMSAYTAAQTGGYTDTEANFYADLAAIQGLASELAAI